MRHVLECASDFERPSALRGCCPALSLCRPGWNPNAAAQRLPDSFDDDHLHGRVSCVPNAGMASTRSDQLRFWLNQFLAVIAPAVPGRFLQGNEFTHGCSRHASASVRRKAAFSSSSCAETAFELACTSHCQGTQVRSPGSMFFHLETHAIGSASQVLQPL